MFTVAITTVLSVLDQTISNVALPTIAHDLHAPSAQVVWVVNAFQLAVTMLIVPLAGYGDIAGFARIYRIGLILFIVTSAGCALAQNLPELVFARCLQGIGAAGIVATSQPIARFAYPRAMLGVAIGIQSFIVSASTAAGPSIGGVILGHATWPWLFWINVPFGIVALALSGLLPRMPRASHRFDVPSAVLSGVVLALFITGLDQLRPPGNIALFAAEAIGTIVLGTILVRRQFRFETPFIALDLLRIRVIRLSLLSSFTSFTSQFAATIALPFYFHAMGYRADAIGYLMTPFALGATFIAAFAGRLADRYHAGVLGAIGLAFYALGMALVALLPDRPQTWDVVWRMCISGMGFSLFIAPNLRAMVHATPRERSGAITGLTTTSRMTGSTTGVALAGLIFSAAGTSGSALRIVLWMAVGLALLAIVFSSLRIESVQDLRREGRAGPWT